MYHGYDVVTQLGRDAVDKREARLNAMKEPLFTRISAHEDGVRARDLLNEYPLNEQDDAFAAMHKLINDNSIMFTGNGIIKVAPEGHNNLWF